MKNKYKTDAGGFATQCDDIKIFTEGSTWNTRLSQIAKSEHNILIMTNGFEVRKDEYHSGDVIGEDSYIRQIFDKRPRNIFVIFNSKNLEDAYKLKSVYPEIIFRHHEKMNAKVVMIEPEIVMFSSADFGFSKQIELGVGFHSEEIYKHTRDLFANMWKQAKEL